MRRILVIATIAFASIATLAFAQQPAPAAPSDQHKMPMADCPMMSGMMGGGRMGP